jgi:hypothetical protein
MDSIHVLNHNIRFLSKLYQHWSVVLGFRSGYRVWHRIRVRVKVRARVIKSGFWVGGRVMVKVMVRVYLALSRVGVRVWGAASSTSTNILATFLGSPKRQPSKSR